MKYSLPVEDVFFQLFYHKTQKVDKKIKIKEDIFSKFVLNILS